MKQLTIALLMVFGLIFGIFTIASAMGGGGHSRWPRGEQRSSNSDQYSEEQQNNDPSVGQDSAKGEEQETRAPLPVPEPGTLILVGLGLAGLVVYHRKK